MPTFVLGLIVVVAIFTFYTWKQGRADRKFPQMTLPEVEAQRRREMRKAFDGLTPDEKAQLVAMKQRRDQRSADIAAGLSRREIAERDGWLDN